MLETAAVRLSWQLQALAWPEIRPPRVCVQAVQDQQQAAQQGQTLKCDRGRAKTQITPAAASKGRAAVKLVIVVLSATRRRLIVLSTPDCLSLPGRLAGGAQQAREAGRCLGIVLDAARMRPRAAHFFVYLDLASS